MEKPDFHFYFLMDSKMKMITFFWRKKKIGIYRIWWKNRLDGGVTESNNMLHILQVRWRENEKKNNVCTYLLCDNRRPLFTIQNNEEKKMKGKPIFKTCVRNQSDWIKNLRLYLLPVEKEKRCCFHSPDQNLQVYRLETSISNFFNFTNFFSSYVEQHQFKKCCTSVYLNIQNIPDLFAYLH